MDRGHVGGRDEDLVVNRFVGRGGSRRSGAKRRRGGSGRSRSRRGGAGPETTEAGKGTTERRTRAGPDGTLGMLLQNARAKALWPHFRSKQSNVRFNNNNN